MIALKYAPRRGSPQIHRMLERAFARSQLVVIPAGFRDHQGVQVARIVTKLAPNVPAVAGVLVESGEHGMVGNHRGVDRPPVGTRQSSGPSGTPSRL
jgi:hypothetical protein